MILSYITVYIYSNNKQNLPLMNALIMIFVLLMELMSFKEEWNSVHLGSMGPSVPMVLEMKKPE